MRFCAASSTLHLVSRLIYNFFSTFMDLLHFLSTVFPWNRSCLLRLTENLVVSGAQLESTTVRVGGASLMSVTMALANHGHC